jgi:hypothetical protein
MKIYFILIIFLYGVVFFGGIGLSTSHGETNPDGDSSEIMSDKVNEVKIERGGSKRLSMMDLYGNTKSEFIADEKIYFVFGLHSEDNTRDRFEIEISIYLLEGLSEKKQILNEKLIKNFSPNEPRVLKWNFIPKQEGQYNAIFSVEGIPPHEIGITVIPKILQTQSPLKQINGGILPENVVCQNGMELIFKSTDESPACVFKSTVKKLIERGWAKDPGPYRKVLGEPYLGDVPKSSISVYNETNDGKSDIPKSSP